MADLLLDNAQSFYGKGTLTVKKAPAKVLF